MSSSFFFFNDTATTEIYTLSLHDALPIFRHAGVHHNVAVDIRWVSSEKLDAGDSSPLMGVAGIVVPGGFGYRGDRKSTRLNSSHSQISYAVFCLKKKNTIPS